SAERSLARWIRAFEHERAAHALAPFAQRAQVVIAALAQQEDDPRPEIGDRVFDSDLALAPRRHRRAHEVGRVARRVHGLIPRDRPDLGGVVARELTREPLDRGGETRDPYVEAFRVTRSENEAVERQVA